VNWNRPGNCQWYNLCQMIHANLVIFWSVEKNVTRNKLTNTPGHSLPLFNGKMTGSSRMGLISVELILLYQDLVSLHLKFSVELIPSSCFILFTLCNLMNLWVPDVFLLYVHFTCTFHRFIYFPYYIQKKTKSIKSKMSYLQPRNRWLNVAKNITFLEWTHWLFSSSLRVMTRVA